MLNEQYEKWNLMAPVGLAVLGLGLSLTGDAIASKSKGNGWFWKGTLGLIVFNAGIAIFGEAIKARALYEWELNKLRQED
ncbi:MAG: hypothetical protein AAFV98_07795 [Chloroflexota bacterium]